MTAPGLIIALGAEPVREERELPLLGVGPC